MFCFFEDAGSHRTGRILSQTDASLQVELDSGRRIKIKQSQLLLQFSQPSPEIFLSQAQEQANSLEIEFLWQCAPRADFSVADFAQEVFGAEPSGLELAGLFIAIHSAPMYFYRKGKGLYRPAPEESLQAALAGLERKRLAAAQQEELERVMREDGVIPPEIAEAALKLVIHPDKQSIAFKALESAAHQLQTTPARLLLDRKALPSAYAVHRARFMHEGLAYAHAEEPTAFSMTPLLERKALLQGSLPLAAHPAYSIDDASTFEVDDAFSLETIETETGPGWRVGVHIAAPGLLFEPESPLGQWARQRASTVYFPGEKITMLPRQVIALASLDEGQDVPAVSLYLEFNAQGQCCRQFSRVERVSIAQNIRHGNWEDSLQSHADRTAAAGDEAGLPWDGLVPLYHLALELRQRREAARGRPEPTGRTDFQIEINWEETPQARLWGLGQPEVHLRKRGSVLDVLVSEFMIATNVAWGETLALAQLPGIYRCQTLGRVRMQTQPGPHQGLGVSHYAWSTSPLRRFSDLVNQWQLLAVLGHRRPAFKAGDARLFSDLAHFDACYDRYGEFQTQMERYWSIRWLGEQAGFPAQETWTRSAHQAPCLEPAVAAREGVFRLKRVPATVRIPEWAQISPGTEAIVEILGGDGLEIEIHARGHEILQVQRVERYAVLGYPVSHSRSPFIHRAFAAQFNRALEYETIEVMTEALPETLVRLAQQGYRGLNLTVPLKEAAYAWAEAQGWVISSRALKAAAINTLIKAEGEYAWRADNTDGTGLVRDLLRLLSPDPLKGQDVLILGAGGATRGLIGPLQAAGVSRIVIANRSVEKALRLVKDTVDPDGEVETQIVALPLDALESAAQPDGSAWPKLLINATAASLQGCLIPIHPQIFSQSRLVIDLMYGDKAAPFLTQAKQNGATQTADGLGMLVEQAAESFFLWTGCKPETEPVLDACHAAE